MAYKTLTNRDKDGDEVRITVEEISNGYLITKTMDYKDKEGNYKCKTKKFFSKEDPFEESFDMFSIMKASIGNKE